MKFVSMPFICILALYLSGFVSAQQAYAHNSFSACHSDLQRQTARSLELQKLVKEDQADRVPPINWNNVQFRDEYRRKRVGEIFGEGCFKSSEDYSAAALIYQHGNVPDHFFQTFVWAKKAVELGDVSKKRLMAMGIDRYLINIGHKQLFATQASQSKMEACWCLEELVVSFPEKQRSEVSGQSMNEVWQWVESLNANQTNCNLVKFCSKNLKNSPSGTVPGFW